MTYRCALVPFTTSAVDRQVPPSGPSARPARASTVGGVSLVQAAMRRRLAERAFEDYVREMARRWSVPSAGSGPGAGDALPKV
jgi:hypothetical protein